MSLSQGNVSVGRFPGLTLRAWVLFSGAGVLIAGSNIASVNRTATGTNTVNFTTALPSVNYLGDISVNYAGGVTTPVTRLETKAIGSCVVHTSQVGGGNFNDADFDVVYVGFYA